MKVMYGAPSDIDAWMEFVNCVKWNFPGLETEASVEEHRRTVLEFMGKRQASAQKMITIFQGSYCFPGSII